MCESIPDLRTFPDKMISGDTATASNPALEVSVSFGRFENDTSLSWEKWSAFSPNKYLEEVEKCATPGSVAQKKAYFEAHYKKIAARKAELLELERLAQADSIHRNLAGGDGEEKAEVSGDDRIDFVAEIDKSGVSGDECENLVLVDRESEIDRSVISDENCKSLVMERESEIESVTSGENCKNSVIERELEIETSVVSNNECEGLAFVEREQEIDERVVSDIPSTIPEDDVANKMEVVLIGSIPEKKEEEEAPASEERGSEIDTSVVHDNGCEISVAKREEEIDKRVVSDEPIKSMEAEKKEEAPVSIENSKKTERGTLKLDSQKEPRKVTSMIKERVAVTRPKKNAMSPNPITRTPNSITRTPNPITRTPNRLSAQRLTNSRPTSASSRVSESSIKKASLSKNNAPSPREAKRVVTPKSIQTMSLNLGTHTKSSSVSSLPADRKSLIMERMGDKDIVKRAFKAFQNKNFDQVRSYGTDESPFQKQVSSKRTEPKVSTSTTPRKENGGLNKTDRVDKRNVKTTLPSSFGSKSLEREDKRRELTKKPDLKSDDTEKTHLQTRSKESLNYKATPMPAFYQGQKISKSSLDKMPAKTVTGR